MTDYGPEIVRGSAAWPASIMLPPALSDEDCILVKTAGIWSDDRHPIRVSALSSYAWWHATEAIRALADHEIYRPKPSDGVEEEEGALARKELCDLIESIWRAEFRTQAPNWKPLPDLRGMISQMDNMYAGIREQRDQLRWDLNELRCAPPNTVTLERMSESDWRKLLEEVFDPLKIADVIGVSHRSGALKALRHLGLIAEPDPTLLDQYDGPITPEVRAFAAWVVAAQGDGEGEVGR